MKKEIQQILQHAKITAKDKAVIRKAYAETGMTLAINEGCPDCWKDALLAVAKEMGLIGAKKATAAGSYKYVGNGNDMLYPDRVKLDENTPDDIVAAYVAANPYQEIYVKK